MSSPAIVPTMPWLNATAPESPVELSIKGNSIVWKASDEENEMDRGRFFVVYSFNPGEERFLKKGDNIIAITGATQFDFEGGIPTGVYRISALDRLNNESQLSDPLIVD